MGEKLLKVFWSEKREMRLNSILLNHETNGGLTMIVRWP